ncbi:MAG: hypothetical protein MJB57_00010 [Gemmatimonadetes bacterium]|nr:hypothetical protein [Gemmatimonadota bacterium]
MLKVSFSILVTVFLFASASEAHAQDECSLSLGVGISAPLSEPPFGDLADLDLKSGLSGGLELGCSLAGEFRFAVGAQALHLDRLLLLTATAGPTFRIRLGSGKSPPWLALNGRVGVAFSFDAGTGPAILPIGRVVDREGTGPIFGGGLRFGVPLSGGADVFLDTTAYRVLLPAFIQPEGVSTDRAGFSILPITAGVALDL